MNAWRISAPWSIGADGLIATHHTVEDPAPNAAMMVFDGFSFRFVAAAADAD